MATFLFPHILCVSPNFYWDRLSGTTLQTSWYQTLQNSLPPAYFIDDPKYQNPRHPQLRAIVDTPARLKFYMDLLNDRVGLVFVALPEKLIGGQFIPYIQSQLIQRAIGDAKPVWELRSSGCLTHHQVIAHDADDLPTLQARFTDQSSSHMLEKYLETFGRTRAA